ncbi:Hypothetical protein A7982_02529 [Minicystis rosea]|nr:Hypothetical protein A7982_02529 [Minicystis rosea]
MNAPPLPLLATLPALEGAGTGAAVALSSWLGGATVDGDGAPGSREHPSATAPASTT